MVQGQLDIYLQKKNEIGLLFHIIYEYYLGWIKDLNVETKTNKLLKENIVINLCDLGVGDGFLDITQKTQATKGKIKVKWTSKLKTLCLEGHHQ